MGHGENGEDMQRIQAEQARRSLTKVAYRKAECEGLIVRSVAVANLYPLAPSSGQCRQERDVYVDCVLVTEKDAGASDAAFGSWSKQERLEESLEPPCRS